MTPRPRPRATAFTLIEMMIVMTIMALLLSLSLGISSSWQGQQLSAEARLLAADFSLASQLAQKDGVPVQFRFYLAPGEIGEEEDIHPRVFQMARLAGFDEESGRPVYALLTEPRYFQGDIVLHPDASLTTVMNQEPQEAAEGDPHLRGAQRSHVSLLFMPDGRIFLPDGRSALPSRPDAAFTLIRARQAASEHPPPDSRTVTLNPVTGKSAVF